MPPISQTGRFSTGRLIVLAVMTLVSLGLGWLAYRLLIPPEAPQPSLDAVKQQGGKSTALPGSVGLPGQPNPAGSLPGAKLQLPDQAGTLGTLALQCLAKDSPESTSLADSSNFGPRLAKDWQGRTVPNRPMVIVLHETVVDEATARDLFRTRHGADGQQASYHVLIGRNGRRIRVVDDGQRAYGAGDSAFGSFSIQLKPGARPSINNIALHVSLVSPPDGADGEAKGHKGYTPEQYQSLATQVALWQARYGIPADRVVTHQEVDRSGTRRDPRSFDWGLLGRDLRSQWVACGGPAQMADLRRRADPAPPRLP